MLILQAATLTTATTTRCDLPWGPRSGLPCSSENTASENRGLPGLEPVTLGLDEHEP
jgi:hypothetical protein